MTGSRLFAWITVAILLPACALAQKQDAASPVRLTPEIVIAGSPELIRVSAPGATSVDGEWLTRKIAFFRDGDEWVALAGVDVQALVGPSTLHITAHMPSRAEDLSLKVDIHGAHYRTESLGVQPKFVEPGPEALKLIHEQSEIKAKAFASSAPEPLWHGDFHAPVSAAATDSFGVQRMFNGKLASIHKGADFRAHTGTPVHAANSGVVVIARPLYYEGNCVIIDHGMGLFTESMHFSRIDVKEGQHVNTGDVLGLSGATGRVTGPHLHWAVRWQGAYLDPIKLLHLNLGGTAPQSKKTAPGPRHRRR
jgi:murein DD-endopeptidase MepM/ murein hydrolase activator NlpD